MEDKVLITKINREEALRYMGASEMKLDDQMIKLLDECEAALLKSMKPDYVYRVFDKKSLSLPGKSINDHLKGCDRCVFLCATLSSAVDRLIKTAGIADMSKALMIDAMASAAVEEVCNQAEHQIKKALPDAYLTWRFGVGYGDFPLDYQPEFLRLVSAAKTIGVTASGSLMLNPIKSVTCIIGLSDKPLDHKKKSCEDCNLAGKCQFRKRGTRCGV